MADDDDYLRRLAEGQAMQAHLDNNGQVLAITGFSSFRYASKNDDGSIAPEEGAPVILGVTCSVMTMSTGPSPEVMFYMAVDEEVALMLASALMEHFNPDSDTQYLPLQKPGSN